MKRNIGDHIEVFKKITEDDVTKFIEISGDDNPIHTDDEFASQTFFKGRIAHGLLSVALISQGLTKLLGSGNIWLSYNFNFKKPIRIGDTITAKLKIIEIDSRKINTIDTRCYNQDGVEILEGSAKSRVVPLRSKG